MAQLTVGLDLGSKTLKRVRLRSSFRTVEVVDFTCIALAEDERPRLERVTEALRQLEPDTHQTDLVATALPGDEISIRSLQLPFKDAKRIQQTIGLELESQIPFSLKNVVYDHLQMGVTAKGGSRHLVALCQIDRLGAWLEALATAGLDPRLVGPDSLAHTSLIAMLPPPDSEGERSVAVLDVGHRLTSLCITGPEGVEFARTLSGGGHDVTTQLAELFKVDLVQAEDGKLRGGFVESTTRPSASDEQEIISGGVKRATSRLLRELRQSLTAHRSLVRRPVHKLWLCGGGAAVDNFDAYLAEELDLEVERITTDHLDLPGIDRLDQDAGRGASWCKALGLALHAHQTGRRDWLNMRRGPFAFKGDFEVVRGKLLHVGVAVLILVVLLIGHAVTRYLSLSSADEALDRRMSDVIQEVLKRPYKDPEVAISVMKENLSPEANLLPQVTAVDVLREIHENVPDDFSLRLKDVNIAPRKVRISGFTDSFESVEKLRASLEEYNCFTEIRTGTTQKTPDGKEVEFRFTIVFGC